MYPIKKIMVCLDMSETDASLVKFVRIFCSKKIEKIIFFHVAPAIQAPPEIMKRYPGLAAPSIDSIKDSLNQKIENEFRPLFSCDYELIIDEGGSVAEHILQTGHKNGVDLIVLGIKKGKESEAISRKIARLSHCSVAITPEKKEFRLNKIAVPVDFSHYSRWALEAAIDIADELKAEIICHHTYHVPAGYHTTGKTYEEFAEIMKDNAVHEYELFMKQVNTKGVKIIPRFTLDKHHRPAIEISQFAEKQKADLLVIGSKGRTAAAAYVFGSVTEKTMAHTKNIPIIVIKDKKENLGFLKAILNL